MDGPIQKGGQVMKTVADIKRKMVIGSTWHALWEQINDGATADMGNRVLAVHQSNSFGFINPKTGNVSWCDWPKKSEVEFLSDTQFRITHFNVRLTYTFIK